jgi:hypothetical protein
VPVYPFDGNVQAHIGGVQASSLEMPRLILPLHVNPQVIRKNIGFMSSFAYGLGMASLEQFIDDRLIHGRAHFSREEALAALDLKPLPLPLPCWPVA